MTIIPATTFSSEEVRSVMDSVLEDVSKQLHELNHYIWSNPELAYEEHKAHDAICDFLEGQGFTVTRHAYGVDTSFECISGTEGRLINLNAEYDALPDIASFKKKYGIKGRIQLLGTPAEENGGGKAKLIDAGAFQGVDISLMAHGGPENLGGPTGDGVAGVLMNARKELHVEYFGKNAHAGGNPWDGVNALDALVQAYNGISTLRQQILPEERIHGAFLDVPKVANVIPAYTKSYWQVRSPTLQGLNKLIAKVRQCIEGAALVTGCTAKIDEDGLYTDIILNETLCERFTGHMATYGKKYVQKLDQVLTGSSDVGNVSYVVPTLHAMFAISTSNGSFPHHPDFTACAGTDEAHDAAVLTGKGLALLGWDMLTDDALYTSARVQWEGQIPKEAAH
ncbi:Peptidase family M20/M25/M40 [Aspergillus parasiticus SU-1]|uniref:Peptidase M20 domain-containing protein 2 n=1 Tax=Aspergillus parasiticus (strain ATCC 56775 / NRRL 5862 / SRRC 143 / SU-1) TaxID=1403190 RepID=A0A0F0IL74_ASPPU|nr:Peptidase family M20/M25/M40 [Aspergillus parasiticus SU-1]